MVEYRNTANRESPEDTKKRGFGLVTRMDLSGGQTPIKNGPTSIAAVNQAQQMPTTSPAPMPQAVANPDTSGKGFGVNSGLQKNTANASVEALRGLSQRSQTFRETVTPEGTKVRISDDLTPAITAEKAVADLVGTMYGHGVARETGAAGLALGAEKNKILRQGQEEAQKLQGRGLLQRETLAEQARGQKAQELFEKQLIERSPKAEVDKSANTKIGMFRMLLEGAPIHDQYKSQSETLQAQFDEFLQKNKPASKEIAVQQFEKMLSGE